MRKLAAILRGWLTHRHLPWHLAALALLVGSPALDLGWHVDDHVHRAVLTGLAEFPEAERGPAELFAFVRGDRTETLRTIDRGLWPWWSSEDLKLAFFRPVTGASHALDYALWPGSAKLMHLHSLLWFALAVALAAGLYRRLLGATATAGLAGLLFVLDDAHALPIAWIANRNATIAAVFGLLTLSAHDRWRRDGWRPGMVLTPLALLLAVLANEGAVAVGGILTAYALCLDRAAWKSRLLSLLPCAGVGLLWAAAYKAMGYGAAGSALYVDPATTPLRFAGAVAERLPLLLRAQWALPNAEFNMLLSESAGRTLWWLSVALLALLAALLLPLARRHATARFFALGMLAALLPACATFPSDRLLFLGGFGAMGLLALLLADLRRRARRPTMAGRLAAAAAALLLAIHLAIAPLTLAVMIRGIRAMGVAFDGPAASLPTDPRVADQLVLIVNTPSALVSSYGVLIQAIHGRPSPPRALVLGSGIYPTEVERRDERTVVIRPQGGYLLPPGAPPTETAEMPSFSPMYAFQAFELLFRGLDEPFTLGWRLELTGVTVEVVELTAAGRAAAVSFTFDRRLEDPSLRWLRWDDGVYAPFTPPPAGERAVLPAARMPRPRL